MKTNELVDSALGGTLLIEEPYSLVNEDDRQSGRFGAEAVRVLARRAEDDRDNLIIILAGPEKQMQAFLASNPGLASRFATRIKFSRYSPFELMALAESLLERRGEVLDVGARPVLRTMLQDVGRRRSTDELGNARFIRNPASEGSGMRISLQAAPVMTCSECTTRNNDCARRRCRWPGPRSPRAR